MKKDFQHIENLVRDAASRGFALIGRHTNGRSHHALTFANATGETVRFVASNSGHGHGRAWLNSRSQLRRAIAKTIRTCD